MQRTYYYFWQLDFLSEQGASSGTAPILALSSELPYIKELLCKKFYIEVLLHIRKKSGKS